MMYYFSILLKGFAAVSIIIGNISHYFLCLWRGDLPNGDTNSNQNLTLMFPCCNHNQDKNFLGWRGCSFVFIL